MRYIINCSKMLLPGIITAILIIITGALALKFTSFPEEWSGGITILAFSSGCLVSGLIAGFNSTRSGLLSGLIVSILLLSVATISISLALYGDIKIDTLLSVKYLIPLISGTAGGIAGANLKK